MTTDPITGEEILSDLERQDEIANAIADEWQDQKVDREEWRKNDN